MCVCVDLTLNDLQAKKEAQEWVIEEPHAHSTCSTVTVFSRRSNWWYMSQCYQKKLTLNFKLNIDNHLYLSKYRTSDLGSIQLQ